GLQPLNVSLVWSKYHAGPLCDPQCLVQVPSVEHIPEPDYNLSIRNRSIRNHKLDLPQREGEKCVAAGVQCRLDGGRMDELTDSRRRRGVGNVVWAQSSP